jgi:sugar O-acyltransferase (sialic acid O-acetyltransferase NeuD family)
MIIFGASGHGKVVYSALNGAVVAFFDDFSNESSLLGIPIHTYSPESLTDSKVVLALGDNKTRQKLAELVQHEFAQVTADSAIVDSRVTVGEGTQILQGSTLQIDCKVGKHVIVNTQSSIDHDCDLGDFVHIAPNCTLCGNVKVGEGTLIGAGSVVLPNITIGKWCTIGAGSVVTKDIADGETVYGNPAIKNN